MFTFRRRNRPTSGKPPHVHQTPPEAFEWTDYGGTDHVVADQPGVGHETPAEFTGWMRGLGERDGAALPFTDMTEDNSPALEIASNASNVRIGVANQLLMRGVAPLEQLIKKAPSLIKA
ncbi:MAG TPA: hypothetical protein VNF73_16955, partial [Candidatus Saccharimonadales bacterium]|nr:hypothetical protein [Candidatus Saccharimonadales bacterium]